MSRLGDRRVVDFVVVITFDLVEFDLAGEYEVVVVEVDRRKLVPVQGLSLGSPPVSTRVSRLSWGNIAQTVA
ncbi:MAG: hypothetical protein HOL51_13915 [Gemmatimonadetes bacterium]|nr:hypothetical protein [Gemmatimonadota bacterium]MBT5327212.1 hypothetical protein [Gemmatimonadota bacterium]MBT5452635.1 hypothetical protein [Gemmatimonadota bacterium]MBT5802510.1 hypothetical protein [Gemmatimonadota bacterium]MBT6621815.1 hypothetical protein [Gemmatimonadota bacterium]